MLAFCTSWPLTDICDNPNTASNQAGAWNHGADFGGGSYATNRSGGVGGYGDFGVSEDDDAIPLSGGLGVRWGSVGADHPMGCWAGRDKATGEVC